MNNFEMTEEQKELFDKLTPLKQGVAINVISGMKPSEAHREAGGECKNESNRRKLASEILTHPDVKAFLDCIGYQAVNEAVMSRQEMLEELSLLSRTNQNDLITWGYRDVEVVNDEGQTETQKQSFWTLKAMEDINPEHLNAIEEVSVGKDGLKFKKVSKLAAMKQLADLAGYNAAVKTEHSGAVASVSINKEEYADIRKQMLDEDDC